VALALEAALQERGHLLVILDDQDLHGISL